MNHLAILKKKILERKDEHLYDEKEYFVLEQFIIFYI
jgi:hypothetical protein